MGKSVAIWYAHHDSTSYSTAIYATRDMGNSPQALVRQIRVAIIIHEAGKAIPGTYLKFRTTNKFINKR